MTRRGVLGWLGGGAGSLLLAGCGGRAASIRYRLTLSVETPTGPRSGSSVLETVIYTAPRWLGNQAGGSNTTFGEAPHVELDDGRILFALLKDGNWARLMGDVILNLFAYDPLEPRLSRSYGYGDWPASFAEAKRTLPHGRIKSYYPMLAIIADPAKPASIAEIDPAHAETGLGAGFRLGGITLQVVPDGTSLSTGINKTLPWLTSNEAARLGSESGAMRDVSLASKLTTGCFRVTRKI